MEVEVLWAMGWQRILSGRGWDSTFLVAAGIGSTKTLQVRYRCTANDPKGLITFLEVSDIAGG
jgi:hypothetical protein